VFQIIAESSQSSQVTCELRAEGSLVPTDEDIDGVRERRIDDNSSEVSELSELDFDDTSISRSTSMV